MCLAVAFAHQPLSNDISRYDRDYLIEARFVESRLPQEVLIQRNGKKSENIVNLELTRIMSLPVMVRTRCRDFGNNGVYKNFRNYPF